MIASPSRIAASTPLVTCQNSGREKATRSRAIRCSMFLQTCERTVPGTKLGYAGVKYTQGRADLIAYLKQATADPKICR